MWANCTINLAPWYLFYPRVWEKHSGHLISFQHQIFHSEPIAHSPVVYLSPFVSTSISHRNEMSKRNLKSWFLESISAQGNFFTYTLFDPLRSKRSETALTSKPSKTLLVYFFWGCWQHPLSTNVLHILYYSLMVCNSSVKWFRIRYWDEVTNTEPAVLTTVLDTNSQTCKWIPNGLFTYSITLPFTLNLQHWVNDIHGCKLNSFYLPEPVFCFVEHGFFHFLRKKITSKTCYQH